MTWSIRTATADDHPRIVDVVDAWWGGRRMSALLPSLFLEHFSGTSFVADDESGELAGFLVGFRSPDEPTVGYVHFVGVRPDQRGTGLGTALHDRFAERMAAYGVPVVRAVTSTRNTASVDFHSRIGFVVDGIDDPLEVEGVDDVDGHVLMSRQIAVADPDFVPRVDSRPSDAVWPSGTGWPIDSGLVLEDGLLRLSVSTIEDAGDLFTALDHDAVWTHLAGRPGNVDEMAALIAWKRGQSTWCPWTVRLARDFAGLPQGSVVGTTSYLEVSPGEARGEIGSTSYTPAVWGTRVNPACKRLLMGHAFDALGWGRLQLKTDVRNDRSQRAIARLGAVYEGTLRRYQRRSDGTVRDTVMFSVIAEEWPQVRDRLDERLT